jgi:hypothetical protein
MNTKNDTHYEQWRKRNAEELNPLLKKLEFSDEYKLRDLLIEAFHAGWQVGIDCCFDKNSASEGSQYVSGVESLMDKTYSNMTEEEKQEAQEYNYWIAEQQIAEQDARYQYENPENTLTNR